jgi:hypothetical protein
MNADEALLKFGRKYINPSYLTIIESLAKKPMTTAELHGNLPDMTINGVKHAVAMLRRYKVVYVRAYLPHSGNSRMLLSLGDYTDAPQIRNFPRAKRLVLQKVPAAMLPTTAPRLGMFGV